MTLQQLDNNTYINSVIQDYDNIEKLIVQTSDVRLIMDLVRSAHDIITNIANFKLNNSNIMTIKREKNVTLLLDSLQKIINTGTTQLGLAGIAYTDDTTGLGESLRTIRGGRSGVTRKRSRRGGRGCNCFV